MRILINLMTYPIEKSISISHRIEMAIMRLVCSEVHQRCKLLGKGNQLLIEHKLAGSIKSQVINI